MKRLDVLLVGDPNIGEEGSRIVRKYYKDAVCVSWEKGDSERERQIRDLISSRRWDILISFYNDLVFSELEISQAGLAVNIHPSTPAIRGVAYDTLPLIEGHETFGVTLHHMISEIDAGEIIDVMEDKIPEGITRSEFRYLNQRLCLEMLVRTVGDLYHGSGISPSAGVLLSSAVKKIEWGGRYVSRKRLDAMLDDLRYRQPDHRVFR